MPEYNWPTKIRRYGITDACQRFLVAKYESIIDWNGDRITSPEDLDRHLRKKMLPKLRHRMDPDRPDSHYCREINLEHMLQNPAPHIDVARRIRGNDGDDAAREFLLDHINDQKRQVFEAWWEYLTEDNPVYAQSPAFQYLMLRPMLDSSNAKCTRSPVNPDAEALVHVFDGIRDGLLSPTEKLMKVLCEFMAFGMRKEGERPAFGTACGWVLISNRMEKAADRVAALSQGSGWCVASPSMAASYLRKSDFHLLVENGRGVAAIRTYMNQAVEIQGRGNRDPGDWWPRILLYCATRSLHIISYRKKNSDAVCAQYRAKLAGIESLKEMAAHLAEHPAQVQFVTDEVANDENYRPLITQAWLTCVKADPMSAALAPSWMPRDGELGAKLIEGWRNLLDFDPASVLRLPDEMKSKMELAQDIWLSWALVLQNDPEMYGSCPPHLCNDPDIRNARKQGWLMALRSRPRDVPIDLQEDPDIISRLRKEWFIRIQNGMAHLLVPYCPRRIVEPLLAGMHPENPLWFSSQIIAVIRQRPKLAFRVPRWLKDVPGMRDELRQIVANEWPEHWAKAMVGISRFKTRGFWKRVPKSLQNHPLLQKQHEANWLRYCVRYPAQALCCPAEFLVKPEFFDEVKKGVVRYLAELGTRRGRAYRLTSSWKRQANDSVSAQHEELCRLVEAILHVHDTTSLLDLIHSRVEFSWRDAILKNPDAWFECPASMRNEPDILAARKEGLLANAENYLSVAGLPDEMLNDPKIRERLAKHWLRQKDLQLTVWFRCPDFVLDAHPLVQSRIETTIIRALRQNPAQWLTLPVRWRRNDGLQREAAECWVHSRDHRDQAPPDDIRERVQALLNP